MKKHDHIVVSVSKQNKSLSFSPILNGDELFNYAEFIKFTAEKDIKQRFKIIKLYPKSEWVKLPYVQAFEEYALSPNINPQDFVKKS